MPIRREIDQVLNWKASGYRWKTSRFAHPGSCALCRFDLNKLLWMAKELIDFPVELVSVLA